MKRQVSIPVWLTGLLLGAQLAVCAAEVDALTGFQVKQGFRLELVAAEPLVLDPVAMSFDGDGRLFVAEHRNFPEADRGTAPLGRIRLLQDADGDGRFETSKDFADGLSAPSALICWDRGVIVAAGTEILHCQDADGDGRAEKRTVLLSAPTNTTGNTGAAMPIRSFVWGLDSRIHAAGGGLGVALPGIGVGLDAAWLPGQDFAFDPRAPAFEIESSFGSAGVSFDSRGRKFVCSETHPLRQVMWEARHVAGENRFALPTPLAEITGPLSATPLLALRAGSDGRPGIGSKNMRRVSEPFAGASSVLVYRGNSYPAAYSEDVFVADARAGVVHRFKLRTNAVELVAERPADDRGTEFLCSTNRWFRPVHLASGPDGALYVVDLHREFLDDTARLTESQSREAMSRRGNDRGRIYRIVPEKFTRPAAPQLENADTPGLLKQLTHLNGWHRDTAARLLHERSDVGAKLLSVNVAELAKSAYARLHALGVLDGQGLLQETNVTRRLRDPDERVRFRAARLAGRFVRENGTVSEALWVALRSLATDPSPHVRYELALALGRVAHPQRNAVLIEVLRRDVQSPWTCAAVLNALASDAGNTLGLLLNNAGFRNAPAGRRFLQDLSLLIGAVGDRQELDWAFDAAGRLDDAELGFALFHRMDEGLSYAGRSLTGADPERTLLAAFQRALVVADDSGVAEAPRVEATRLLAAVPFAEASELLFALVNPVETERVQLAAVETLGRFDDLAVGRGLTQRWGGMRWPVRAAALEVLLARASNAAALLDAVQTGRVGRGELSATQIALLRTYPNPVVAQRANALFASRTPAERSEAMKRLLPALRLRGDAARGRQVYLNRCVECHRFRGEGFEFGPDLEGAAIRDKLGLLREIVEPNHFVPARAMAQVVETRHRGGLLGIVELETPAAINLRQPGGATIALPRVAVGSVSSLDMSAMPEGLEAGLSPQAVADLLEYLVTVPR